MEVHSILGCLYQAPMEKAYLEGDTLVLVGAAVSTSGAHEGYRYIFAADEVAMIREALGAGETGDGATIASLRKRLALVQS